MKNDYENKIDRIIIHRFKVKLMNNTKWREVFNCLAQHKTGFYLSFIDNRNSPKNLLHHISLYDIKEREIGDSGIGDPFFYKEIYSLIIPKIVRLEKKMRGEIYGYKEVEQKFEELLASLHGLGQLPLTETDQTVEINGYI